MDATRVRRWWLEHSASVLRVAVVLMGLLAALKLGDELLRLAWRSGPNAAIDLKLRYAEVHAWFVGRPVYQEMSGTAIYPPASYVMLWPLLGWLPLAQARVLWAAISAAALVCASHLLARESKAKTRLECTFVALTLLSMNETGVWLGNGQLVLLQLPVLLVGLLVFQRGRGTWRDDLVTAGCLLFSLVKHTTVAPFFWLAFFAPMATRDTPTSARVVRLRPAALVFAGYTAMTLLAVSFMPDGRSQLLAERIRAASAGMHGDYADLNSWLSEVGLKRFVPAASITLFCALGAWTYLYRRADLWIRIGVCALIARFWTYHRLYDDVIVSLALVTLFRLAKGRTVAGSGSGADTDKEETKRQVLSGTLLGATSLAMLLPARLHTAPVPWQYLFNWTHAILWLGILWFLCREAHLETFPRRDLGRKRSPPSRVQARNDRVTDP